MNRLIIWLCSWKCNNCCHKATQYEMSCWGCMIRLGPSVSNPYLKALDEMSEIIRKKDEPT